MTRCFAVLLTILPMVASAGGFEKIKGFELGMTLDAVRAADAAANADSTAEHALECFDEATAHFCSSATTLAEIPVHLMLQFYPHQGEIKLAEISATGDASRSKSMLDALTAKFGKPSATKAEPIQNLHGAKFERTTLSWNSGKAKMELISPCFQIDNFCLSVLSLDPVFDKGRRSAAERAKDL